MAIPFDVNLDVIERAVGPIDQPPIWPALPVQIQIHPASTPGSYVSHLSIRPSKSVSSSTRVMIPPVELPARDGRPIRLVRFVRADDHRLAIERGTGARLTASRRCAFGVASSAVISRCRAGRFESTGGGRHP